MAVLRKKGFYAEAGVEVFFFVVEGGNPGEDFLHRFFGVGEAIRAKDFR